MRRRPVSPGRRYLRLGLMRAAIHRAVSLDRFSVDLLERCGRLACHLASSERLWDRPSVASLVRPSANSLSATPLCAGTHWMVTSFSLTASGDPISVGALAHCWPGPRNMGMRFEEARTCRNVGERFGKVRSAGLARRRASEHRVLVRIAKHWAIQQAKDEGYPEGMEAVAGWIAGWVAVDIYTVSPPRLAFPFFLSF